MGKNMFLCFCISVSLYLVTVSSSDLVVDTEYGKVTGHKVQLSNGKIINSFLGIPFAKPPVGPLRFERPQKPDHYGEGFIADTLGAICPQRLTVITITHPLWENVREDCLNLNIFAPNQGGSIKQYFPVMVYIHGGAYKSSGTIQYPGHFLAEKGVVVVVLNYRLRIFGFISTGDDVARGNVGLYDQLMALQYVQNNIRGFGGDPNRVTAFGQSAGASSVGFHMASPLSKGLFQQAIFVSGTELGEWAYSPPELHQENYTKDVANKTGCPTEDSREMVECLKQVDMNLLIETPPELAPGFVTQGFAPVIDGPGGMLPDRPEHLRSQGKFEKMPTIVGYTKNDASLYVALHINESNYGGFTYAELKHHIRDLIDGLGIGFDSYRKEQMYQALKFEYTNWTNLEDLEGNRQILVDMFTDYAFGYVGDIHLKVQSEFNTTYQFILGFRSSNAAEVIPKWLGTPHNGELPYVFGWAQLQQNEAVRQDMDIYFDLIEWDDDDILFAEYIQTLWVNFAKAGNPTPKPVKPPFDKTPIKWLPFSKDELNYIQLDREVAMGKNYRQHKFAFIREYGHWILTHEVPVNSTEPTVAERSRTIFQNGGFVMQNLFNVPKEKLTMAKKVIQQRQKYLTLRKKFLKRFHHHA